MESVVITTSKNPEGRDSIELCQELRRIIPRSVYISCNQELPEHAILVKVIEGYKKPLYVKICDSTGELVFKVITYKSKKYLKNRAVITNDSPQLVVHNFKSTLGSQVVDWLAKLFSFCIEGRQVASFQCKNDFVFFRMYRYIFRENHVDMQDIGPHLVLRLKKLTVDSELVYEYKKYERKISVL